MLPEGLPFHQCIVNSERTASWHKTTAKFNETRAVNVSARTVRRRLTFSVYGKVVYKVVIKVGKRSKRVHWCRGKRWRSVENIERYVIFSDEIQVCLGQVHFPANDCVSR